MPLTKRVPAHTITLKAIWCNKEFMRMSPAYRLARRNMKPMDTCHWCHHKFEDGEMMALACIDKTGNKIFCQDCASELVKEPDHADQ